MYVYFESAADSGRNQKWSRLYYDEVDAPGSIGSISNRITVPNLMKVLKFKKKNLKFKTIIKLLDMVPVSHRQQFLKHFTVCLNNAL